MSCKWSQLNQHIAQSDAAESTFHSLLHLCVEDSGFQQAHMVVAPTCVADKVLTIGVLRHLDHARAMVDQAVQQPATWAAARAFFVSYTHWQLQSGKSFQVRWRGWLPRWALQLSDKGHSTGPSLARCYIQ